MITKKDPAKQSQLKKSGGYPFFSTVYFTGSILS
jgi:hypothetical protein